MSCMGRRASGGWVSFCDCLFRVSACHSSSLPYLSRIEETFLPWLDRTVDTILPLLTPQATTFETYSRTDLPPPLYHLRFLEDSPEGSSSFAQMNEEYDALEPGWKWAKLRRNTRVTDGDWWQDVREIDLDLEDSDQ